MTTKLLLDGDAARIDLEPREEVGDGRGPGSIVRIAVERESSFRDGLSP